ncbi:iron-containing alcohol dehydrogenase [Microbacteriaceae bacterium VKM Ac-2854]|nr:iron-containing alcohol dehydrogenase [Microbacteriaceae bacterium VKM Ac-2854]
MSIVMGSLPERVFQDAPTARTLFVVDVAVRRQAAVAVTAANGPVVIVDPEDEQDTSLDAVTAAIEAHRPERIVGIGGGRVHDTTALARLFDAEPTLRRRVDALVADHGGIIAPAPRRGALPRLALVPTTIGPGSETSSAACREHGGFRSVLVGSGLRADSAILDPGLTATLTRTSVLEGAAEAVLRLLGARGGSPSEERADAETAGLLTILAQAGARVARCAEPVDRVARAALAHASAASHETIRVRDAAPFAATPWYFANELSSRTGLRKVVATVPLLPVLWRRESAPRRARRRDVWRPFATALGVDLDPLVGVVEWARRWGFDAPAVLDTELSDAADAIERRWGGTHAALPGLDADDAFRILRSAFASAQDTSASIRKEVNT